MLEGWLSFYQDVLDQWPLIVSGILATVKLTLTVSVTGFALGVLVFFWSLSKRLWLAKSAEAYKSFFIGTPLICIIYILYYGLPSLGIRLSPFEVMVIGFTANVGAYNAAYLLTAYNGLDKSQLEAATVQGFTDIQIYMSIVLPQVLRTSIPALTNQVIYNLKDSSIAFLVQYPEFFARMQELAGGNFEFFKTYTVTAVFYVLLASVVFTASRCFERRNARMSW